MLSIQYSNILPECIKTNTYFFSLALYPYHWLYLSILLLYLSIPPPSSLEIHFSFDTLRYCVFFRCMSISTSDLYLTPSHMYSYLWSVPSHQEHRPHRHIFFVQTKSFCEFSHYLCFFYSSRSINWTKPAVTLASTIYLYLNGSWHKTGAIAESKTRYPYGQMHGGRLADSKLDF